DLVGDGGVDELGLLRRITVTLVGDLDVLLLAGRLSTVLDDVPERVAGPAVGHDGDADLAARRRAAGAFLLLGALRTGARAGDQRRGNRESQQARASRHGPLDRSAAGASGLARLCESHGSSCELERGPSGPSGQERGGQISTPP